MYGDGYQFSEVCKSVGITLQDGLKMFVKNNIYIDKETTYDTPFMGSGLNVAPYCLRTVARTPDTIYINLATKLEIQRRLKLAHPKLVCYLKNRFEEQTINPRMRLSSIVGKTDKFVGVISCGVFNKKDRSLFTLCVKDVAFAIQPDIIIADHLWVGAYAERVIELKLSKNTPVRFSGLVSQYSRFDEATSTFQPDYRIKLRDLDRA